MKHIDLNDVHFGKSDRIRYRKQLTAGVLVAAGCGCIGSIYGFPVLEFVGVAVNSITAAIWIWE